MRLLIVNHDPRDRRALAELARQLGHASAVSPSSKQAMARLRVEPFDLVLTELRAPGIRGMQLLRTVERRWPHTRVAMITPVADEETAQEARRAGALASVGRPVDRLQFRDILSQVRLDREAAMTPIASGRRLLSVLPTIPSRSMTPHDLGEGRLESEPGGPRLGKVLRIDATEAPPNLLGRLLVGSYVTGHDHVLITARGGLRSPQRNEIRRMVDRILGMTVVGDTPAMVEVQNFIDPSKYELPRLLPHVVQLLRAELAQCRTALAGSEPPHLELIETMEDEIDQFYLLMVRQLLLSSDSPRIAHSIDVESHHYQIGYRLVAKVLELAGDLIQGIGAELGANLPGLRRLPRYVLRELTVPLDHLDHLLSRTMTAFTRVSVGEANTTLNLIHAAIPKDTALGERVLRHIQDGSVAVAAERIACNLVMALEMLIIINEVTINRSVEPETMAHTGTHARTVLAALPLAPAV